MAKELVASVRGIGGKEDVSTLRTAPMSRARTPTNISTVEVESRTPVTSTSTQDMETDSLSPTTTAEHMEVEWELQTASSEDHSMKHDASPSAPSTDHLGLWQVFEGDGATIE